MGREIIVIDTSILIDHLRKTKKQETILFNLLSNFKLVISTITEFEFKAGITARNHNFAIALLSQMPITG